METKTLLMNKLKDDFYSFRSNESPGYNRISYNVIKKCFDSFCKPLKYLLFICLVFFQKIVPVTQIYKSEDSTRFFIRKPFFCLRLNFLNIMLKINLRFSQYSSKFYLIFVVVYLVRFNIK